MVLSCRIAFALYALPSLVCSLAPWKDIRAAGLTHNAFKDELRNAFDIRMATSADVDVEEVIDLRIDRAPCYDGLCTSSPKESNETMGEATVRLGGPAVGPTVWSEFGRMASENPRLANLGQGFPDWLPPKFAIDSLVEAAMDSSQSPHQYTRTAGHPNLVKQLAKRYSTHLHRDIDPMAEVAITVGASQALYLSLQSVVKPGK